MKVDTKTPLSTIFKLYSGGQFYWLRKREYTEKTQTCRKSQVTDTLSHNVVSSTPHLSGIWTHNISGDRHWLHIGSCKSNHHLITTMTALSPMYKSFPGSNLGFPIHIHCKIISWQPSWITNSLHTARGARILYKNSSMHLS